MSIWCFVSIWCFIDEWSVSLFGVLYLDIFGMKVTILFGVIAILGKVLLLLLFGVIAISPYNIYS